MNWLSDPQSDYVIAAYAIAALFLLVILVASGQDYWRAQRALQKQKDLHVPYDTTVAPRDPS